jgi:putative ABC transport system ATP-binding protein
MGEPTTSASGGTPPEATSDLLLEMQGVSKVFESGQAQVLALNEVDLVLRKGELVVVLGPSGSGKTTLLNLIGGLDRPTSGTMSYVGTEIARLSDRDLGRFRREHIGFVFQFFNLIPTLTARENVEFAAELVMRDRRSVDETVERLLALVGLKERADHFPSQLSGGEQQRVAIARALAKDPDVLLCDEPTGNLDFRTGRQILAFLQNLTSEHGKTCVLVTHNNAIASIGDRVIRLRDGRVQSDEVNGRPVAASEIEW